MLPTSGAEKWFSDFHNFTREKLKGRTKQARVSLAAMLTGGHILIEDIPGVGKTTFALMLARLSGLSLKRIQCTNDMLPSDIIGPTIWHPGQHEFIFKPGPIFSPMVLVDELNRAPSKTQSGLLQAMEERKISIDGNDLPLPMPFIVMATQNPNDGVGNNPLPESQIDRFSISFRLDIPAPEIEVEMIQQTDILQTVQSLPQLLDVQHFSMAKELVKKIFIHPDLLRYIMRLLEAARGWPKRSMLLSTRAGRDLVLISRALALIDQEEIVFPAHIHEAFPYVCAHRLGGDKGVEFGQTMAAQILEHVPVS
ncbi:MAG: AAA family ATPase [Bdellovibrio sp.]|nr:AAA family ATPase [Bdellovibrio sp.]